MRLGARSRAGERDVAVVDVGSNSVRLVVYRIEGRTFTPILNDRVAAGLGRAMSETGRLSDAAVQTTLAAARRFRLFLQAKRVPEVYAVGTAAVRDASNAAGFLAEIEAALGAPLRVLSGQEEGRYAALGVLAGNPAAKGLVADFGGASLELAPVSNGEAGEPVTLNIGALSLTERAAGSPRAVRDLVEEALDATSLEKVDGELHAVGGAWRNFAKIVMVKDAYPLAFLQGYRIDAEHACDIARVVSKMSPSTIARMSEVSRRRSETMPVAAVVLERLLRRFEIEAVEISAYGLREGILLETIPDKARRGEPLVAAAEVMARRAGAELAFGRALETWIEPLTEAFGQAFAPAQDRKLIVAACRLADLGGGFHPDHRAELTARQVLYAPLPAANHPERAFLALAVHHRYAGRSSSPELLKLDAILSPEARQAAMRVGLAMRLAGSISARAASLLKESRIEIADRELRLSLTANAGELATEVVEKRLAQLGEALELIPVLGESSAG